MPIVPAPQRAPADIRQIPHVQGFTISGDELGASAWGEIGRAGREIGRAIGDVGATVQRVRDKKDTEAADDAAKQYMQFAGETWDGKMDEATGEVSEGMGHRTADAAQNVARDFTQTMSEWHEKQGGVYASLTPRQQKKYNELIEPYTQRYQERAVQFELGERKVQRRNNAAAHAATTERSVDTMADASNEDVAPYIDDHTYAVADLKFDGQFFLNPDGSRNFASGEVAAAHQALRETVKEKKHLERAAHQLDQAANAPLGDFAEDPVVEGHLATAQSQVSDTMTPAAREKISRGIENVRAIRARLEDAAAKNEEISAYVAMAEGRTYDTGGIPRKVAALERANKKWGAEQLKTWSAKAAKARKENSAYASEMAATGFWKNEAGEIVRLSTDDQYSVLRAALYNGDITLVDYKKAERRVQQREQSQNKEAYDRAVQDVAQIFGHTIKTVWTDRGAALAGSEDPNQLVTTYKYETTYSKKGEAKKHREYRKLLTSDIPVLINLLANARKVDGMRLDLDGNLMTEPEMMDAGRYRPELIRQFQQKLVTLDIHSGLQAIAEARRQLDTQRDLGYVIALGGSFERGQPIATPTDTEDEPTEEPDDE